MKRFTLFTFLYLALGVCLTAIALGYPNLTSSLQTSLFINAGASYIVCILSTFPFWREMTIRIYRRQNLAVILPWLPELIESTSLPTAAVRTFPCQRVHQ